MALRNYLRTSALSRTPRDVTEGIHLCAVDLTDNSIGGIDRLEQLVLHEIQSDLLTG